MARLGLVQFSRLSFIVFLMCPKRIRPAIPNQQEYNLAVKRPSNAIIDVNVLIGRTQWAKTFVKDDKRVLKDVNDEPGFDISDDEIKKFKLWPKGLIPYYIDTVSYSDKVLRDRIRLFLNTVNSLTKLRFVELPNPPENEETRYVFFVNRRGQLECFDHSTLDFTDSGVQTVHLGYDCLLSGGELAQAVLSIAGVPAQHNSPNRDDYIKIIEDNIDPDKKHLFQKLKSDEWIFDCESYDYQSVSHYGHHKYSINGKATIRIQPQKNIPDGHLGDNHRFTISDIMKIRMLYNYIVRRDEAELPTCEKLFRKGDHFRDDISPSIIESQPRPPSCPDTETTENPIPEDPIPEDPIPENSETRRI